MKALLLSLVLAVALVEVSSFRVPKPRYARLVQEREINLPKGFTTRDLKVHGTTHTYHNLHNEDYRRVVMNSVMATSSAQHRRLLSTSTDASGSASTGGNSEVVVVEGGAVEDETLHDDLESAAAEVEASRHALHQGFVSCYTTASKLLAECRIRETRFGEQLAAHKQNLQDTTRSAKELEHIRNHIAEYEAGRKLNRELTLQTEYELEVCKWHYMEQNMQIEDFLDSQSADVEQEGGSAPREADAVEEICKMGVAAGYMHTNKKLIYSPCSAEAKSEIGKCLVASRDNHGAAVWSDCFDLYKNLVAYEAPVELDQASVDNWVTANLRGSEVLWKAEIFNPSSLTPADLTVSEVEFENYERAILEDGTEVAEEDTATNPLSAKLARLRAVHGLGKKKKKSKASKDEIDESDRKDRKHRKKDLGDHSCRKCAKKQRKIEKKLSKGKMKVSKSLRTMWNTADGEEISVKIAGNIVRKTMCACSLGIAIDGEVVESQLISYSVPKPNELTPFVLEWTPVAVSAGLHKVAFAYQCGGGKFEFTGPTTFLVNGATTETGPQWDLTIPDTECYKDVQYYLDEFDSHIDNNGDGVLTVLDLVDNFVCSAPEDLECVGSVLYELNEWLSATNAPFVTEIDFTKDFTVTRDEWAYWRWDYFKTNTPLHCITPAPTAGQSCLPGLKFCPGQDECVPDSQPLCCAAGETFCIFSSACQPIAASCSRGRRGL